MVVENPHRELGSASVPAVRRTSSEQLHPAMPARPWMCLILTPPWVFVSNFHATSPGLLEPKIQDHLHWEQIAQGVMFDLNLWSKAQMHLPSSLLNKEFS